MNFSPKNALEVFGIFGTLSDVFQVFRYLQISISYSNADLKYIHTFAILILMILGITCNYICITLFDKNSYYVFALYITVSIIALLIILLVIPTAANLCKKSQDFVNGGIMSKLHIHRD